MVKVMQYDEAMAQGKTQAQANEGWSGDTAEVKPVANASKWCLNSLA